VLRLKWHEQRYSVARFDAIVRQASDAVSSHRFAPEDLPHVADREVLFEEVLESFGAFFGRNDNFLHLVRSYRTPFRSVTPKGG
jgi:hypothetical protein